MARHRLVLALPLFAALGCSSTAPSPDEAGVTTEPSGSADVETGVMDETTSESESESGFKLDVAPLQDFPMPACWVTYLTEAEANAAAPPDCSFGPFDPGEVIDYLEVCAEPPRNGDCASICPPNALCEGMEACYSPNLSDGGGWYQMCGPNETVDGCCLLLAKPGAVTTN
jgi:hypothetical protein